MADAVIEGRRLREVIAAEEGTEEVNQADMLDQYGSQDTIDRLKSGLDVAQTDAEGAADLGNVDEDDFAADSSLDNSAE